MIDSNPIVWDSYYKDLSLTRFLLNEILSQIILFRVLFLFFLWHHNCKDKFTILSVFTWDPFLTYFLLSFIYLIWPRFNFPKNCSFLQKNCKFGSKCTNDKNDQFDILQSTALIRTGNYKEVFQKSKNIRNINTPID